MSENGSIDKYIAKISISYDPSTGQFTVSSNLQDEVLTTGMLETAKEKLKENYQLQRLEKLRREEFTKIVPAVQ